MKNGWSLDDSSQHTNESDSDTEERTPRPHDQGSRQTEETNPSSHLSTTTTSSSHIDHSSTDTNLTPRPHSVVDEAVSEADQRSLSVPRSTSFSDRPEQELVNLALRDVHMKGRAHMKIYRKDILARVCVDRIGGGLSDYMNKSKEQLLDALDEYVRFPRISNSVCS